MRAYVLLCVVCVTTFSVKCLWYFCRHIAVISTMFSSLSSSLRTTSEPHTSLPETICWYLSLGLLFIIITIHVVIVKLCTEYAYVVYKSRVLTRIVTHYRIIVFSREIAFIICSVPELIRRRCWCSDSKKYCIPSAKTTQTIFLFFL